MIVHIQKIGIDRYRVKIGYSGKFQDYDGEDLSGLMLDIVTAKGLVEFQYDDTRFDVE